MNFKNIRVIEMHSMNGKNGIPIGSIGKIKVLENNSVEFKDMLLFLEREGAFGKMFRRVRLMTVRFDVVSMIRPDDPIPFSDDELVFVMDVFYGCGFLAQSLPKVIKAEEMYLKIDKGIFSFGDKNRELQYAKYKSLEQENGGK